MSFYCIGCGLSTSIKDFNNNNVDVVSIYNMCARVRRVLLVQKEKRVTWAKLAIKAQW